MSSTRCAATRTAGISRIALGILTFGYLCFAVEARSEDPEDRDDTEETTSREGYAPIRDAATEFFDRVWGYTTLYDDPDNRVVQNLSLVGRFQLDYAVYDANRGSYDKLQVRRLRVGGNSRFLSDFTLHGEVDFEVDCDDGDICNDGSYEGLTDAYLGWRPSEAFELKVGKVSAPFTLDGATSSKRLITLERNNLTNNLWFPVEYHSGGSIAGRVDEWVYRVGAYSSATKKEFGRFDGGFFLLFSFEYDLSKRLDVPEFEISADYVYNEEDEDNVATRSLTHVVSLRARFDSGKWGFRADLSGGRGYEDQRDLFGLAIVPFYHITRNVQIVARYTHLSSAGNNGIRLARWDDRVSSDRGGAYDEIFGGFNWFLYGHDLKLQTGFKYSVLSNLAGGRSNYRGWGWTNGLRIAW
jgi:phosphate-selective porin OprO/OprP